MAAEYEKAALPLLDRAIGKYEDIPGIFPSLNNYGAKAEFIYLSYAPLPFP